MKGTKYIYGLAFLIGAALTLGSCTIDYDPGHRPVHYGPSGLPGLSFFGVDFDYSHPYSYWDDNPDLPFNPQTGIYYETLPGVYEFEYFVNRHEFWYGWYEIWNNPGGSGRTGGRAGFDGNDSYLMLICNPNGYYEYRENIIEQDYTVDPLVIERKEGDKNFKITLFKGDLSKRTPHIPKYTDPNVLTD